MDHSKLVFAAKILPLIVDHHMPNETAVFRPEVETHIPDELPRPIEGEHVEAPKGSGGIGLDTSIDEKYP